MCTRVQVLAKNEENEASTPWLAYIPWVDRRIRLSRLRITVASLSREIDISRFVR